MRANTPEQAAEAIRLHKQMMGLLAQMATLPYGSVMNYNASGGGRSSEHPGGKQPAGVAYSDEDRFRERWYACRTVKDGRECVQAAVECLDEWRKARPPVKAEDPKALARDIQSKRGWKDREVADAMRLTVAQVHQARLDGKCCPALGYPYTGCSVVELANRGNSVRQIEEMLRISKSTVDRMLKRAA